MPTDEDVTRGPSVFFSTSSDSMDDQGSYIACESTNSPTRGSGSMTDPNPNQNGDEMRVDPQRATQLAENIAHVYQRIQSASNGRKVRPSCPNIPHSPLMTLSQVPSSTPCLTQ